MKKMKKLIAIVLCFVCLATCLTACGKKATFRKAAWGMDQKAVIKSEDTEYVFAGDDILYFNDVMYDINTEILYTFKDNALSEAQAKFLVMDWILEDIIANYKQLAEELTKQYGAPLNEDYQVWKTDHELYEEYKDDTEFNAMYWKILEFKYEWKTETSYYSLSLNYKDEQINYVFYGCPLENAPV